MITKIGQNDISPFYNYDLNGPNIDVDFNTLDNQNLPKAKVGFTYPVFSATAHDAVTKDSPVKVRVFYNYFATQRFELQINDGKFLVERAGRYTIEYRSKDYYGNESVELVHIETTTTEQPILLDLDETLLPDLAAVGSRIDIPAVFLFGWVWRIITQYLCQSRS